jgi:cytochrome c-type biogenesis protein CcmH/NrfG
LHRDRDLSAIGDITADRKSLAELLRNLTQTILTARESSTTLAPSRAADRAVAAPMPDEAPVTRITALMIFIPIYLVSAMRYNAIIR